ncbi:hypothetical protein [Acutalibacter muris]|uniref:hypothetical protein n=1 Tax=Acutalibacter muris TaxID=1796620 RepID=UPI00272BC72A|nr:hypothetical protein [Acutalibacter muris]
MQEERLTLGVCVHDIASCNICYARNYDSSHGDAIGDCADKLYELKIGSMVLTLCDKCLDRLRETLTQRQLAAGEARLKQLREKLEPSVSAKEKPEASDGQTVLFTGTEFTAMNKLGKTYRYRMIGAEVTRDGLICLLNLDTNSLTYVEPEWFRQRKIKVIQKEQE